MPRGRNSVSAGVLLSRGVCAVSDIEQRLDVNDILSSPLILFMCYSDNRYRNHNMDREAFTGKL